MSGHHRLHSARDGDYGWLGSRKRKGTGSLSRIASKRSTQAIGIAALLLLLLWFASYSHQNVPSIEVQKPAASQTEKYAIITFETRSVTYWKESLGNKVEYSRRYG